MASQWCQKWNWGMVQLHMPVSQCFTPTATFSSLDNICKRNTDTGLSDTHKTSISQNPCMSSQKLHTPTFVLHNYCYPVSAIVRSRNATWGTHVQGSSWPWDGPQSSITPFAQHHPNFFFYLNFWPRLKLKKQISANPGLISATVAHFDWLVWDYLPWLVWLRGIISYEVY